MSRACAVCGRPWPAGLSVQGLGARRYCGPSCRAVARRGQEAARRANPPEPSWEQEAEQRRTVIARERTISREDRARVATAGPVRTGPVAPFHHAPLSHRWTADGEVMAVIARPKFDDTQACLGDDRFLDDDAVKSSTVRAGMAAMCGSCPFFRECYDWALAHERYGFLAGLSEKGRVRERVALGVRLVERTRADLYGLPVTKGGEAA